MKIIKELAIVMGILFIAHVVQTMFALPIPDTVLGMLLLFVALVSGVVKLEDMENVTPFALKYLTFLFIPGGVGLIASLDLIKAHWLAILLVIILTTIFVITITGSTVQLLNRVKTKKSTKRKVQQSEKLSKKT